MAAILLTPRMLLYPPPPGLSRNLIADELILRVRVLENGGAKVLSDRNDWLAHCRCAMPWRDGAQGGNPKICTAFSMRGLPGEGQG